MFTLKQMQVLEKVAQTGSLNGAAIALGYGMPTISHHLRSLEQECQSKLIERSSRGTRLTLAGEVVLREAKVMLARAESLEKQLAKLREADSISLRIGTFASIGSKLVPYTMRELAAQYRVRVELTEAETSEILQQLADGNIDVGLVCDYDSDPLQLDSTKVHAVELFSEPFQVLVGAGTALAQKREVDFAELLEEPWIMSRVPDEVSDRVLIRACAQYGATPRRLVATDDLGMIHALVSSGQGISLTTRAAFEGYNGVRLLPVKQRLGNRRVWFVRNKQESAAAALSCETLMSDFVKQRKFQQL